MAKTSNFCLVEGHLNINTHSLHVLITLMVHGTLSVAPYSPLRLCSTQHRSRGRSWAGYKEGRNFSWLGGRPQNSLETGWATLLSLLPSGDTFVVSSCIQLLLSSHNIIVTLVIVLLQLVHLSTAILYLYFCCFQILHDP